MGITLVLVLTTAPLLISILTSDGCPRQQAKYNAVQPFYKKIYINASYSNAPYFNAPYFSAPYFNASYFNASYMRFYFYIDPIEMQ